jgi:2'-5' RNA ligase|tara:strand:+ start:5931 stop:6512 length:582 start_codon:yes stop_codon:yes gene_type:complete
MSERLIRTFVSVSVPKEIVNIQSMLKSTVEPKGVKVRWVMNGKMHLTLKFLGNTTQGSIDNLNEALFNAVKSAKVINLSISGTGAFPVKGRPNVLWLGIKGDIDELKQLTVNINNSLEPLGFITEKREFLPHVTIARIKSNQKKIPNISNYLNTTFTELPMKIVKISLMQSESFSKGTFYTILGTHFFRTNLE